MSTSSTLSADPRRKIAGGRPFDGEQIYGVSIMCAIDTQNGKISNMRRRLIMVYGVRAKSSRLSSSFSPLCVLTPVASYHDYARFSTRFSVKDKCDRGMRRQPVLRTSPCRISEPITSH